jgi:hypothetical protein
LGSTVVRQEWSFRRRIGKLVGIAPIALSACSGAPAYNILGSYFPAWMLCALAGICIAAVVHRGFAAIGIGKVIPAPLIVFLALAVFFSFLTWLLWLS